MGLFDIFNKKKPIPAPWEKYYTDDELNYKIPNISLYDQIKKSSEKFSEYYAIEYMNKKVKYKDFIKLIDRASLSFKSLGVKKGDIVTICLPNLPEALISLYALNKLGAIANMVHPLSAEEEIKHTLVATKSKYMILVDMFYNKIENTIRDTDVKKVIFVSPADSLNIVMRVAYSLKQLGKYKKYPKDALFMNWRKFMKYPYTKDDVSRVKFGRNTPSVILHSGGTTGKPKHVVIQNRSFLLVTHQAHVMLRDLPLGSSCLAIMPNFHGFGLAITQHVQIVLGFKVILIPQFDATKFDTLLKKTKPSLIVGVPTLFEAMVKNENEKNLDLSFVKHVVSGGDALHKKTEDLVNEYLKEHNSDAFITQGYGMTEALSGVCLALGKLSKSGSVGVPLPGNYIKIIDPSTRKTLPYGEIGEIVIHNQGLMMGYLNEENETNEVLQVHDDGHIWLHSGDLGMMDTDGFIYYKGRQKRMIISSGYNVYPAHVEEVIESHPAVLQCTVVGIPHPYKQEVPKAFIVLKEGFHGLFIKSEIKNYCKKNLAKYMVPHDFVYRKQLPKTKLGKVDFQKLKSDIGVDDDE